MLTSAGGEKHLLAQVATHHTAGHAGRLGHQLAAEVPIKWKPGRALSWKGGGSKTHTLRCTADLDAPLQILLSL